MPGRSVIKVALFLALCSKPRCSSDGGLDIFFDKLSVAGDGTSAKPEIRTLGQLTETSECFLQQSEGFIPLEADPNTAQQRNCRSQLGWKADLGFVEEASSWPGRDHKMLGR